MADIASDIIVRFENEPFGIEQFRSDKGGYKLFKGHAVVAEESAEGKGKGGEDTDHADLSLAHHAAQEKVCRDGHRDGQQREQALAQREAEEQAFVVVADLFVDAYFYKITSEKSTDITCNARPPMVICHKPPKGGL